MTIETFDQWIDLVGNGDIKEIENEISNNKNILNLQDNDGNSPLLYSLKLQKILEDKKNGKKMTFDDKLKFYITYMDLEKVQEFINSGVSVSATYEGLTLLQHAKNVYNEGERKNDDNIDYDDIANMDDDIRTRKAYKSYWDNYTNKWRNYNFNDSVINYLEISGAVSFKFNINNLTFEDNQKIIELLINKGADLNLQDNNKDTALLISLKNGYKHIAELLINKGADLNLQDNNKDTALLYSLKLQKILLDKKNGKKMTFDDKLKYYITYMDLEKVKGFINSGVSVNATYKNDSNLTLLQHAKNVFNPGMRRKGIDYANKTYRDDYTGGESMPYNFNDSVINYLKKNGAVLFKFNITNLTFEDNQKIIELLINKGADLNLQNNNKDTALLYSSKNGYKDIAELLINKGADLNLQDNNKDTALLYSLKNGYKDIAELLIDKGADLNLQDNNKDTALLISLKNGYKDIAKLIIEKGSGLNQQDNNKDTALLISLKNGYKDIAELLIDKGADLNLQDNNKEPALFHAVRNSNDNIDIVKLLIEKGSDKDYIKTYEESKESHNEYIGDSNNFKNFTTKGISRYFQAVDIIKTNYIYNFNILRIAKDLNLEKMISYLKSLNIKELPHSKQVCTETSMYDKFGGKIIYNKKVADQKCSEKEYF